MASPGPIYASTLHRRDRAWGPRRRTAARLRGLLCGGAGVALCAALISHLA